MKFNLLIEELLNEATPVEIYNTYYSKIPSATFIKIISADPQSVVSPGVDTKIENRVKKIGKFSKLLLSMFIKNSLKFEDLDRATEYLGYLYKHKISVDVTKINLLSDLYDLIKKYLVQDKRDLGTILQSLPQEEYKILLNGEKWYIMQPLTEKASCYLGINTEWCTAWGPLSFNSKHKDKSNRFESHNSQGPLYIIINKTDENDKYQFHFESKQFMNPADKQINTGNFLSKNTEVKNFFFPSFVTYKTTEKQNKIQIGRMNVLNSDDSLKLMKMTLSGTYESNPIILNLINKNYEGLNEYIKDSELTNSIDISGNYVVFLIKSLNGYDEIESVDDVLRSYESDKYSTYDRVYSDLSDRFYNDDDDDDIEVKLEPIFKKYYEENTYTLRTDLGIFNYEQFKKDFFKPFCKDEEIQGEFLSQSTTLNTDDFENQLQNSINQIEKYIKIDRRRYETEIELNVVFFSQFLLKNDIKQINDNLFDLIETYIRENGIETEREYYYGHNGNLAGWEEMKSEVEDYFEKLIDNSVVTINCVKVRKKFDEIFRTVFKGNSTFENEHVFLRIKGVVNCENQSVDVEFKNKDTNKIYNGAVKVENLPSYVTNYQLFENFITFKKNIL